MRKVSQASNLMGKYIVYRFYLFFAVCLALVILIVFASCIPYLPLAFTNDAWVLTTCVGHYLWQTSKHILLSKADRRRSGNIRLPRYDDQDEGPLRQARAYQWHEATICIPYTTIKITLYNENYSDIKICRPLKAAGIQFSQTFVENYLNVYMLFYTLLGANTQ